MSSLRALYFEAGSGSGGSSASLYRLIKVLRQNGVTPIVVARQNGPNIDKIRGLGIQVFLLPRFWKGKVFIVPRLLTEMVFLGSI